MGHKVLMGHKVVVAGQISKSEMLGKPMLKWNAVMKALAELYELYYTSTSKEHVLEALQRLMEAYNEWLD